MFGIVIDSRGNVFQVRLRYTIIGLGPFPAYRKWIDWAGRWTEWGHLRHWPHPWTAMLFDAGHLRIAPLA